MLRRKTESPPRRLETPVRASVRRSEVAQRSHSRVENGGSGRFQRSRSRLRDCSSTREQDRLLARERELYRERERLQKLEDEVNRKRIQLRSTEHHTRERDHSRSRHASQRSRRSRHKQEEARQRPVTQGSTERSSSRSKRLHSPSFTTNDVVHILNAIKDSRPRPSTSVVPILTNSVNHKNILPDFDPSSKNQRIDIWLK